MSLFSLIPSLDTILALPTLSYLLLPTMGGYATSLNLLFFYLTWATLVLSHSALNIQLWGTVAVRALAYVLPSTLFLLFDVAFPGVAQAVKAHGRHALPIASPGGSWQKTAIVASVSTCNVLLGAVLQAILVALLGPKSTISLKASVRLPLPWGIAKDLVRGFVVRGTLQYYLHRHVLHGRSDGAVAGWLARQHKAWQHSVRVPYAFVANYDHPAAWLVCRWLPLYAPALLFRFHLLTWFLLLALVSLEETFAWSGYVVLPGTIMLRGVARRCDEHLMTRGRGNFAPWGILDFVHGTTISADVVDDISTEMRKHDVVGRAKRAKKQAEKAAARLLEDDDSSDSYEEQVDRSDEAEREEPPRAARRTRVRPSKR